MKRYIIIEQNNIEVFNNKPYHRRLSEYYLSIQGKELCNWPILCWQIIDLDPNSVRKMKYSYAYINVINLF